MSTNEQERTGKPIMLYSGRMFWPLDPRPEDIAIDEIIVTISHKLRFNASITSPYTVGMHTLAGVAECLRRWPEDYSTALKFFLHDAGEAYGPDISSPVKEADLGELNTSEAKILAAIGERFGIQGDIETEKVIEVDHDCLKTEFNIFMPHTPKDTKGTYSQTIAMDSRRMLDHYITTLYPEAVARVRGMLHSKFGYLMGKMG